MLNQIDALGGELSFDGFSEADFAAFEPKKWGSRVYTMERRAARAKAVALARAVVERAEGDELLLGASDDAPSMANQRKVDSVRAYLTRPAAMQTAIASRLQTNNLSNAQALFDLALEHRHASLLFSVSQTRFTLEYHLSPLAQVDRMNFARKLEYEEDRTRVLEIFSDLEESALRLGSTTCSAPDVDQEQLEAIATSVCHTEEPVILCQSWEASDPVLAEASFSDVLVPVGLQYLQVWKHLSWSPSNDFAKVGVDKAVAKAEKKMKRSGPPKEDSLSPGVRVTILSGLFAGRAGYLAEPDGKGNVRVMVGPVSVSVPAQDIKPA